MRQVSILLASLAFTIAIPAQTRAQTTPDQLFEPVAAQVANSEETWRAELSAQIKSAWNKSDFKTLEGIGQGFVTHPARSPNGEWQLRFYMSEINALMNIEWPNEWNIEGQSDCNCKSSEAEHYAEGNRRWNAVYAKLNAWAKHYPHSVIVPVARGKYAMRRAWFYRGSSYADKVSGDAWPKFEHYVQLADKNLKASAAVRFVNPEWYSLAAELAVVADWPDQAREQLHADMVDHATGNPRAFAIAAGYMDPKWDGKFEQIEPLFRKAQQHLPEKDGLEFYARAYWSYFSTIDRSGEAPKQVNADWAMIKQGLEIIQERYPVRANFDGAGMMACKFHDKEYFDIATRRARYDDGVRQYPYQFMNCNEPGFGVPKGWKAPDFLPQNLQ